MNMLAGNGAEDWQQFVKLMNLSSAHELRSRIDAALAILKGFDFGDVSSNISATLIEFLDKFQCLDNKKTATAERSPTKDQAVTTPQGIKKLSDLKAVSFCFFLMSCY